jgi:sec-independent protein translocase protein TatB
MLDIGWSELLVIAIVAIVVVGPKDLPKMMRTFGLYAGKLRRAAADFQRQFNEAIAESEADEVRKNLESIRSGIGDFKAEADTPLMTGEPARTAVGAPPLDTQEAEPPAPAKPKPAARAKRAAPKSKKAVTKKPVAKKAVTKTAGAKRGRAKPKAKSKANTKAKAKTKAEPKP